MHAVWEAHKYLWTYNFLIFGTPKFYGASSGDIFNFDRYRTSELRAVGVSSKIKIYRLCVIWDMLAMRIFALVSILQSEFLYLSPLSRKCVRKIWYMVIYITSLTRFATYTMKIRIFWLRIRNKLEKAHNEHTSYYAARWLFIDDHQKCESLKLISPMAVEIENITKRFAMKFWTPKHNEVVCSQVFLCCSGSVHLFWNFPLQMAPSWISVTRKHLPVRYTNRPCHTHIEIMV